MSTPCAPPARRRGRKNKKNATASLKSHLPDMGTNRKENTMNELEIKAKLDQLSDFQAHRDLLDADKRTLLEDVKIPEEVQAIVKNGMERISKVGETFEPYLNELRTATTEKTTAIVLEAEKKLSAIVIPPAIRDMLAEIDRQRADVVAKRTAEIEALSSALTKVQVDVSAKINATKMTIQTEIEAQTADVYKAIAQRKAEIEAEFAGKAEAVDDNIRKLTEEIKAEVKTLGTSVKADHFHAVYVKGRITWDTSKMDGYAVGHPEVLFMRKEGDPSVTLRPI
jgi:hypothetical protein